MTPADTQRYAVAKLVGYCDGILSSGILGEHVEGKLREQVALTCTEFGMPVKPEVLPPDAHLDSCLLPEVEGALNDDLVSRLSHSVVSDSMSLAQAFFDRKEFDQLDLEKMEEAATRLLFLCSVVRGRDQRTAPRGSRPNGHLKLVGDEVV